MVACLVGTGNNAVVTNTSITLVVKGFSVSIGQVFVAAFCNIKFRKHSSIIILPTDVRVIYLDYTDLIVVLGFVPPTAKVIPRRVLGLKSHRLMGDRLKTKQFLFLNSNCLVVGKSQVRSRRSAKKYTMKPPRPEEMTVNPFIQLYKPLQEEFNSFINNQQPVHGRDI